MAYELREGFGNAFKNSFKEKDNQPDFTGDALWKGDVIRIALWKKQTSAGDTFVSIGISEKEKKEDVKPSKPNTPFQDMDDDIPF